MGNLNLVPDFWQRSVFSEMEGRIKSGRVLFIMDNVIALFAVFSLIGYFSTEFLSASQRSAWAKTTLVLAAIHGELFKRRPLSIAFFQHKNFKFQLGFEPTTSCLPGGRINNWVTMTKLSTYLIAVMKWRFGEKRNTW